MRVPVISMQFCQAPARQDLEIEIDTEKGIARLMPSGTVSVDGIIEMIHQMLEHPDFRPGMPSLWDYRACDAVNISTDDLRRIGNVASENAEQRGSARLAVVTGDDLQFGLSRMFAMMNDLQHLDYAVFRDISEAEHWLTEPIAPGE